ncbi:MAG: hypothetical protein R2865_06175 [Deinococcales bacterium]
MQITVLSLAWFLQGALPRTRDRKKTILADAPVPKPITPPSPRSSNLPRALPSGALPVQANLLTTPTRLPLPVVAAPVKYL